MKHTLQILLLAMAASVSSANAATINVNLSNTVANSSYGTVAGQLLAPTAYTGSTWNSLGTNASGTNMMDSDGNTTTIDFTLASTSTGGQELRRQAT